MIKILVVNTQRSTCAHCKKLRYSSFLHKFEISTRYGFARRSLYLCYRDTRHKKWNIRSSCISDYFANYLDQIAFAIPELTNLASAARTIRDSYDLEKL